MHMFVVGASACVRHDSRGCNTCFTYKEGVCAEFLSGSYVKWYPAEQHDLFSSDLAAIKYTGIILPLSDVEKLHSVLMNILCHMVFPVCYMASREEAVVFQKICQETCLHLHSYESRNLMHAIMIHNNCDHCSYISKQSRGLLKSILNRTSCLNEASFPEMRSAAVPQCYYLSGMLAKMQFYA